MAKRKNKLSDEEKKQRRTQRAFSKQVSSIFTNSGFLSLPVKDHQMFLSVRNIELDGLFVYENIWLVTEDTIVKKRPHDHLRTKDETAGLIKNHFADFIKELEKAVPLYSEVIHKYQAHRIRLSYLYFSKNESDSIEADQKEFQNLKIVDLKTLNYFKWISSCIRNSAKYELFNYLKIDLNSIGDSSSSLPDNKITAPIIYPSDITGLANNVRVVSFMMKAQDLLEMSYVLRKDSWNDSFNYQRLLEKNKVKSIRDYIYSNGESFYNNIIVALPDTVYFLERGCPKKIEEIQSFTSDCKLIIPKELNSICLIDGQHRVFAYYESGKDDIQERKIRDLRSRLHLLVTGLVFPPEMANDERIRIQSKIFLDINSNAKPVHQSVLLRIKRILEPISSESIAQLVIEKLNKKSVFKDCLQISEMDEGKIKTASIVRFALRYLVWIKPTAGRHSLFEYWDGDKEKVIEKEIGSIEQYADFCASQLNDYFSAIKKNNGKSWNDEKSRILSVVSLNGFILAYARQLGENGLKDFAFFDERFSHWSYDFSVSNFPYTSSQYHKFSEEIYNSVFGISDNPPTGQTE